MKIKLSNEQIRKSLDIKAPDFPKYVTQILNLANQNAQGTKPKVVGQMSSLIQQFKGHTGSQWEEWYIKQYPEAIKNATAKIWEMVKHLKEAMSKVNDKMVEQWVKGLVIVKTFLGLKFQEAILKKSAEILKTTYRLSNPDEESQGTDGYIGKVAVSIKPDTYKGKKALSETIPVRIIYYCKLKDGI
ncbi:MAG: MjaI family restriction endonuclease, partial [Planctomycetota bacterium]|nr:MjaI family restriction endonuclease [Planctomycetota bacterium]